MNRIILLLTTTFLSGLLMAQTPAVLYDFDCDVNGWIGLDRSTTENPAGNWQNGLVTHENGVMIVTHNGDQNGDNPDLPNLRNWIWAPQTGEGHTWDADVNKYVHVNLTLEGVDIDENAVDGKPGILVTVNHQGENFGEGNGVRGFRVVEGTDSYTADFTNDNLMAGTRRIIRLHFSHNETEEEQAAMGYVRENAVWKINWIAVTDSATPPTIDTDADDDGIGDACDACMETVVGADIDETGCEIVLNVKDNSNGFAVYPNPTTDFIRVSGLKEQGYWNVIIFDVAGRKTLHLKNILGSELKVDVSSLPKGIYHTSLEPVNHQVDKIKFKFVKD